MPRAKAATRLRRRSLAAAPPPRRRAAASPPSFSPEPRLARSPDASAEAAGLVADDAASAGPSQIARDELVARVRDALLAACDGDELPVARAVRLRLAIPRLVDYYGSLPAGRLEKDIRLWAPPSRPGPDGLVEAIVARVLAGARAKTPSMPADAAAAAEGRPAEGGAFQAKPEGRAALAPRNVGAVRSALGAGRPIENGVRSRMERGFGTRFDGVRVHTDSTAAALATDFSARAFTIGGDIAFGAGTYRPGTEEGDRLLAHELAHTLQQQQNLALHREGGGCNGCDCNADVSPTEADAGEEDAGVADAGPSDAPSIAGAGEADAGAADAGTKEEPTEKAHTPLSEADKATIVKKTGGTAPTGPGPTFSKDGPRFILHDTGAKPDSDDPVKIAEENKKIEEANKKIEEENKKSKKKKPLKPLKTVRSDDEKEKARAAELAKIGGTSAGEGPTGYVTTGGDFEMAHPKFYLPRRVTATEFEKGQDLMSQIDREKNMQAIWAATAEAPREAALDDAVNDPMLSTKQKDAEKKTAREDLDASKTTPRDFPKHPAVHTAATWAVARICEQVADPAVGAKKLAGDEAKLDAGCKTMAPVFAARAERIPDSTNLEIYREAGTACSTDSKTAQAFAPYPAAVYKGVEKAYLLAALEAGQFPELTTHYFLDSPKVTKSQNRCDPRCFRLDMLYGLIQADLGHKAGSTYGVPPKFGTSWGTDTVWWFDPVCGKKP